MRRCVKTGAKHRLEHCSTPCCARARCTRDAQKMSWDDDAESSADELTHTTLTRAFRSSRAAEKAALDEFVAVERDDRKARVSVVCVSTSARATAASSQAIL